MSLLAPYLIFGIVLFLTSFAMLATVLLNRCIREKYLVFSVKFGVDILTALCLCLVGCLDRSVEGQCDTILVISTSIPFVQALLLVSEVADWWLAAFSPVYFHNSSLVFRFLPFFIGVVFCVIIMAVLTVFDLTTETVQCTVSPGGTYIMLAYDISLFMITLCLGALSILLMNHLRSVYFRPIMFHFVATLLLQEIPLICVIALKYTGNLENSTEIKKTVLASDITNFLVATHSLAHTAFFIYGHEDYRQAVLKMVPFFRRPGSSES